MPTGNKRSRTYRRVFTTAPGGETRLHYKKRKPSIAKCGACGIALAGVPRERPYKMTNMAKSKKRPERAFGGVLCPACTKRVIIARARQE